MGVGSIIAGIIAVITLAIGLPIMVTNLVTAQNTTNAPTDFTSALALSFVLLGLAPAGVLFVVFIRRRLG